MTNLRSSAPGNAPALDRLRLVVGIPSTGRSNVLAAVLPHIARQTRLPEEIIICVAQPEDIDLAAIAGISCPVRVLVSRRGSCRQRNHILDNVADADVVLFLDDDFLMAPSYLERAERLFAENPEIAVATGTVIADGITGPGISVEEAMRMLEGECRLAGEGPVPMRTVYSGYGCNMAVRMSSVREGDLRFDENLPLYGWLEDVDFSRLAARHGQVVCSSALRGVHLGTKGGRTSGEKFGYSQIANPVYLMRKQTMSTGHACMQMGRNLLANFIKAWKPEPWVDRKGRLKGNLLAFADLATNRLTPRNVERLN